MSRNLTIAGIYCIINNITGKLYIGSAINLEKRKNEHFCALAYNRHKNQHLQNSVNKYSLNMFSFQVIELVDDKKTLIPREQFWINETRSYNSENGYNILPTAGSNLGVKFTNEHKTKLSNANKGKKRSVSTCQKIGISKKGQIFSDTHRAKLSIASKGKNNHNYGKKHSQETRQKISNANKGSKLLDSTRLKISEALRGEKNPFYGRTHTKKSREKISEKRKYCWKQYYKERDKKQQLIIF